MQPFALPAYLPVRSLAMQMAALYFRLVVSGPSADYDQRACNANQPVVNRTRSVRPDL